MLGDPLPYVCEGAATGIRRDRAPVSPAGLAPGLRAEARRPAGRYSGSYLNEIPRRIR